MYDWLHHSQLIPPRSGCLQRHRISIRCAISGLSHSFTFKNYIAFCAAYICPNLRPARVLLTPLPVREPLTLLLTGLAIGLQLKAEVTSARGRLFATNQTEVWTASAFTRIGPTKVSLKTWVYDFQTHQSIRNHSVLWTPFFKMTNLDNASCSYFICIATGKIVLNKSNFISYTTTNTLTK